MKKFILLAIVFVSGLASLRAQDPAVFNHYLVSPILVNPSYAGFAEQHDFQFNFRNQWTGFPGAPFNYGINYNGPIGKTLGIGVGVFGENIAAMSRLRFLLNYAFRYQIKSVKLSIGFSTEFQSIRLSNSVDGEAFYEAGDQLVESFQDGERIFDATLGAYATFRDQTYIGLAFPNLIVAKISDIESGDPEGSFFGYYVAHVGHRFDLSSSNISIEPSVMVRQIKDVPLNLDFNLKAGFLDNRFITGLSYRTGIGGALGLLLGTELNTFRLFYTYDLSFQRFQQYNSGAHEITVAMGIKGKKKKG